MMSVIMLKRLVAVTVVVLVAVLLQLSCATSAYADFIKAQPINGLWWLIDPSGKPFVSTGVDNVNFYQDFIKDTKECPYATNCLEKYKSQEAWRQATIARLLSLNFNTLGAWSDEKLAQEEGKRSQHLYYTIVLHAADSFEDWNHSGLPDFYDPKFEASVKATAKKLCSPHADDDRLIGYFGDNELPWVNLANPILIQYLNEPLGAPGRLFATTFLKHHYPSFSDFNRVWTTNFDSWAQLEASDTKFTASRSDRVKQEKFEKDCNVFAGFASSQYFEVVERCIKAADPNHLNLGCRFMVFPGIEILRACTAHVDVVSFNCYELNPEKTITKYEATGKPLLIGEFSFRGADSGLPNKRGGGPLVASQKLRGDYFTDYVKNALKSSFVVGYHWFEHADQPKEGRFDGEDSNYGLVSIKDEPYLELTQAMRAANLHAHSMHAKADQP
jgi:agarase